MPVTLLAVDDSVTMRKVLEMTFAGEDYRVLTADSAEGGLTVARAERPAVVLADATLDGRTGYELCSALKREMPTVPVLVLSSKLHPYDPAKGQAAHVDDHIDKPFDTQQLIDKVRALTAQAASPRPPVAAAQPARPPAPPPAATGTRPAPPPVMGARPAAPAAGTPGARPAPQNLRHTIAYPGTGAGPLPQPGARPAAQPPAQPRPMAPAPQPAAPSARPASPPAVHPAPVAHPAAPVHPAAPPTAAQPQPAAPAQPPQPVAASPAVAAAVGAIAEGELGKRLAGLGLNKQQIEGVLALSHEVVERVVWEVVPVLAETIIKEELKRLTAD